MKIVYGDAFLKSAAKLPLNQQKKLDQLLAMCAENPSIRDFTPSGWSALCMVFSRSE